MPELNLRVSQFRAFAAIQRIGKVGSLLPYAAVCMDVRYGRKWQMLRHAHFYMKGGNRFSVCGEVKELGYWSFGVVVLSEVGLSAS